eukprot:1924756-Rhodomonas_salina.3
MTPPRSHRSAAPSHRTHCLCASVSAGHRTAVLPRCKPRNHMQCQQNWKPERWSPDLDSAVEN